MRTGASYLGSYNPRHMRADMEEMRRIRMDDVLICAQENDFHYFMGKLEFGPKIARDNGLRPIILFYGLLNLFGGGRSSQFLLTHPEAFQIGPGGKHIPRACINNPACLELVWRMLDKSAESGFEGYFVDEPSTADDCRCAHCRVKFAEASGGDIDSASDDHRAEFRDRCAIDWVRAQTDYCKATHPQLETQACFMPHDRRLWQAAGKIASLDNLGTNVYLTNRDVDIDTTMSEPVQAMAAVCRENKKLHHEWLQCFRVKSGREPRIRPQGELLIREKPDCLYVWAYNGQCGSLESCENPEVSWSYAAEILSRAK